MNVSCPECRSVFRLDPAKITSLSMRARCSVCGGLIPVGAAVNWGDDLQMATASTAAPAPTPGGIKPVLSTPKTPSAAAWPPPLPAESPPASKPTPAPTPRNAPPVATPTPVAARSAEPPAQARPRTPPFSPRQVPVAPKEEPPQHATTPSSLGMSFGAPLTPPSRSTIPESPAAPRAPTPPPAFAASGNVSAAFSTPSTPAPAPAVVQRRPINPFLANDPNQKARRLARALVSDMVAYHPSKREEGLHGGTLKQLFRDEIKKSYEEYVEQVGREFAESTAHFQEALNDVLAGGRKIF